MAPREPKTLDKMMLGVGSVVAIVLFVAGIAYGRGGEDISTKEQIKAINAKLDPAVAAVASHEARLYQLDKDQALTAQAIQNTDKRLGELLLEVKKIREDTGTILAAGRGR